MPLSHHVGGAGPLTASLTRAALEDINKFLLTIKGVCIKSIFDEITCILKLKKTANG